MLLDSGSDRAKKYKKKVYNCESNNAASFPSFYRFLQNFMRNGGGCVRDRLERTVTLLVEVRPGDLQFVVVLADFFSAATMTDVRVRMSKSPNNCSHILS